MTDKNHVEAQPQPGILSKETFKTFEDITSTITSDFLNNANEVIDSLLIFNPPFNDGIFEKYNRLKQIYYEEQTELHELAKKCQEENLLATKQLVNRQEQLAKLKERIRVSSGELSSLRKKEFEMRKTYEKREEALDIALNNYKSYFGIDVKTRKGSTNTIILAELNFQEKPNISVELTLDLSQEKIIDFCFSSVINKQQEEELKAWFRENNNIPGLMYRLRTLILNS